MCLRDLNAHSHFAAVLHIIQTIKCSSICVSRLIRTSSRLHVQPTNIHADLIVIHSVLTSLTDYGSIDCWYFATGLLLNAWQSKHSSIRRSFGRIYSIWSILWYDREKICDIVVKTLIPCEPIMRHSYKVSIVKLVFIFKLCASESCRLTCFVRLEASINEIACGSQI